MSGGPRLVKSKNGYGDDKSETYRVKMSFCWPAGCQKSENPFLEALEGCGGIEDNYDPKFGWEKNEDGEYISGKGSLLSQTIASRFSPINKFVEDCCEEKNEDGSYLTEIQIRSRFYEKMHKECTGEYDNDNDDDHECVCSTFRGACGVLPGDTVFWEYGWAGETMTHFEPATHEELKERKWLSPLGQYEYMADQFRQKKALGRAEKAKSDDDLGEQGESKRLKQEG